MSHLQQRSDSEKELWKHVRCVSGTIHHRCDDARSSCWRLPRLCSQRILPSFSALTRTRTLRKCFTHSCQSKFIWRSWIRASWYNYENNQQDALHRLIYYSKSALPVSGDVFAHYQEHLTVFTVSGSVHPSCCRNNYESNQQDALYRLIYYSKSALHVSGDVFAHYQEHLTVFTVSGSVHPSCCRLVSRNSGNLLFQVGYTCFGRCFRPSSGALDCIYSIW